MTAAVRPRVVPYRSTSECLHAVRNELRSIRSSLRQKRLLADVYGTYLRPIRSRHLFSWSSRPQDLVNFFVETVKLHQTALVPAAVRICAIALKQLPAEIEEVDPHRWAPRDVARIVFACGLLARENAVVSDVLVGRLFSPHEQDAAEGAGYDAKPKASNNIAEKDSEPGEATFPNNPAPSTSCIGFAQQNSVEDESPVGIALLLSKMNPSDLTDTLWGLAKLRGCTFYPEDVDAYVDVVRAAALCRSQLQQPHNDHHKKELKLAVEWPQHRLPAALWAISKLSNAKLQAFGVEKLLPQVDWYGKLSAKPALLAEAYSSATALLLLEGGNVASSPTGPGATASAHTTTNLLLSPQNIMEISLPSWPAKFGTHARLNLLSGLEQALAHGHGAKGGTNYKSFNCEDHTGRDRGRGVTVLREFLLRAARCESFHGDIRQVTALAKLVHRSSQRFAHQQLVPHEVAELFAAVCRRFVTGARDLVEDDHLRFGVLVPPAAPSSSPKQETSSSVVNINQDRHIQEVLTIAQALASTATARGNELGSRARSSPPQSATNENEALLDFHSSTNSCQRDTIKLVLEAILSRRGIRVSGSDGDNRSVELRGSHAVSSSAPPASDQDSVLLWHLLDVAASAEIQSATVSKLIADQAVRTLRRAELVLSSWSGSSGSGRREENTSTTQTLVRRNVLDESGRICWAAARTSCATATSVVANLVEFVVSKMEFPDDLDREQQLGNNADRNYTDSLSEDVVLQLAYAAALLQVEGRSWWRKLGTALARQNFYDSVNDHAARRQRLFVALSFAWHICGVKDDVSRLDIASSQLASWLGGIRARSPETPQSSALQQEVVSTVRCLQRGPCGAAPGSISQEEGCDDLPVDICLVYSNAASAAGQEA